MGQTLTHGIYLPDEGERNCYSGLAANWQLLDGAVGTVAEHTTALAGKAADSDVVHKTGNETIAGIKSFLNTNIRFNSSSYVSGTPSNNIFYAPILIGGVVNNTDKNTFQHNAAIRTTGINDYSIRVYSQTSNTLTGVVAETNADASIINFRPIANKTHNLGTSSYQWKTLNGVNPGALGLPSGSYDPIDTDGWDFTGATGQSYTPTVNGWLFISIQNTAGNYLSIVSGKGAISIDGTGVQGGLRAMLPVIANESVGITVKTGVIFAARFYPMLGNVS